MSQIKIWNKVPDRSRLHVEVTGQAGTASGIYSVSDGTAEDWTNAQLRAGVDRTLRTPKLYNVTLTLKYAKAGALTVAAFIEKPGGTHHGKDFEVTLNGQPGDVKIVAIGAVTLQS